VLAFVSACDSGRIFVLGQERVCLNQIVSSLLGVADYPVSWNPARPEKERLSNHAWPKKQL